MSDRQPFDQDAEFAVVSAAMDDADARRTVAVTVTADSFYLERHRRVYRAILATQDAGLDVDPLTVAATLDANGELESVGGRDFLFSLTGALPTLANVGAHAQIVREWAQRRAVHQLLATHAESALDRGVPVRETVTGALTALLPNATDGGGPGYRHVRELIYASVSEIEARTNGKRGLMTGYDAIDGKTHGFRGGELVIPAGAEKSGKSVFALNVGLHVAQRRDAGVAYVSAEMQAEALIERCLATLTGVSLDALSSGRLSGDEWRRVSDAAGHLTDLPFWIDAEAEPLLGDVLARAEHLKALHPEIRLVIVDFLQLISHRLTNRNETAELKAVAYALKGLAKRLDVVVLAPCQVNSKEIEDGKEPRPRLKDLQGSSGMRQAADFVALIYRPGLYDPAASDEFELNFAACRRTERFTARLRWHGATMTIR